MVFLETYSTDQTMRNDRSNQQLVVKGSIDDFTDNRSINQVEDLV